MRRFAAIPAHPQKQYTRRWRLYHFCGFYYPIREVIPIAIYHCNISIVSRGKGKSAVAAAAYRSGEKLTNEWDGMTHDYTRKGGVVHTEIMLPPHAPPSFSDRSTLWNSVELYEKAGNAQLAREIDAALPIELSREEQIRLVREYCSSQFVSRGMCVDFAIHDTDSGNPHCHIMLTMRPLDERGTWTAKSKKEYDLDENGERIRLPSGRYKTHKVDLTGWNNKDNTLFVPSDIWLRCRKKLMTNITFQNGRKARNTWLAGKIKCGKCGYALKTTHNPSGYEYLRCSKRADHKGCPGCGTLRKNEFEQFIFTAMGEKFREFKLLRGGEEKANPKITAYQVELAQVEAEIEKLLDTLTGANATLLAYANKKIEDLDNRRKTLSKAIADLSVETLSSQQIELLSGYLDDWENISFEDKRKAADGLISSISATSDYVKIEWKI